MSDFVLTITPFYVGILGLMFVFLTLNVTKIRIRERVSLLDGGKTSLSKAIRAQGNFVETVPLVVFMMALLELNGFSALYLHLIGATLVLGRSLHAFGMLHSAKVTKPRLIGMMMTMAAIVAASVSSITVLVMA